MLLVRRDPTLCHDRLKIDHVLVGKVAHAHAHARIAWAGQQRAWWRAPASASAQAFHVATAARAHAGPLLAIARDNQIAHQLESDLRTLIGGDTGVPVLPFPAWETLPCDQFSPHPDIVSQRILAGWPLGWAAWAAALALAGTWTAARYGVWLSPLRKTH